MTRAQRFSIFTCFATYVLIVIGGVVRITDSGLGCPDWPLCHGEIIPPAEKEVLIEFSHRTAATLVGFFILGMGWLIWRQHRERHIRVLMLAVFPLLGLQVILGGITVERELPASVVATHHATAMLLLALLILVTTLSIMTTRGATARPIAAALDGRLPYARWAIVGAVATLALMTTGSYIAVGGASLAFTDWPLFDGKLFPEGGRYQNLHYMHRVTAAAVGVIILAVAVYTHRTQRRNRALMGLAWTAVALYAMQVMVGAGNIWTKLNDGVTTLHLMLAVLIWITFVLLSILAFYEASPAMPRRRKAEAPAQGLAHER